MHSWCVCSRWNGFSPPASKRYAFSSTTTACDTRPITLLRLRTRLSIECCPRVRHHGTTPPRGGCVPLCGRGNLAHPRHCVNAVLECRQRAYDGGVFRRPRRRAVALRVRSQHLAMAPRPAAGRSRVLQNTRLIAAYPSPLVSSAPSDARTWISLRLLMLVTRIQGASAPASAPRARATSTSRGSERLTR